MNERHLLRRAARRALRTALSVPAPVLRRALGPAPTNDRGAPLDLQTQALLRLLVAGRRPPHEIGLDRMRRDLELQAPIADVAPPRMHRVEDRWIHGADDILRARVYEPEARAARGRPMLLYFHGGGFVIGAPESHDAVCRYLAARAGCVVASIDYRLGPEHRFPAAPRDAIAAFRWAASHAEALGVDPRRIAVGGDSAGANLAAVIAREARQQAISPAFQLLVYPATDLTRSFPSHRLFAHGYLLDAATLDWFVENYLVDPARDALDPLASPLFADDLRGVAPAYLVTAGFDPLRDEGEAYAKKLGDAGVPIELRCEPGLVHGFFSMGGVIDAARASVDRAADALARGLAAAV